MEQLNIVYTIINPKIRGGKTELPGYYILYPICEKGSVNESMLWGQFNKYKGQVEEEANDMFVGPFSDYADLSNFGHFLLKNLGPNKIKLISVDEMNSILEKSSEVLEIKNLLENIGDLLETTDKVRKISFIEKLFN